MPRFPGTATRVALLAPAAVAMLLGIDGGLLLIGVPVPALAAATPELHAPLMVFGFVGGVIALERAIALKSAWAVLAPILLACGSLLALAELPWPVGRVLVVAGAVLHVGQYLAIWRRQEATAVAVQALGATCAALAALVWAAGVPAAGLVPLLAAFPILTIAGERLELARVAAPPRSAERLLAAIAVAVAGAAVLCLTMPQVATVAAGLALLALVAWLLQWDIARATVRGAGLPRYVAVCLLAGYGWLALAGAGWVLGGADADATVVDAVIHAIFLGFVISMIMAHAPIILPAVLAVRLPYHPVLYVPVAVLQASLLVRVVGGDAWGSLAALRVGGAGSAIAMVLFAVTVIVRIVRGRRISERSAHRVAS